MTREQSVVADYVGEVEGHHRVARVEADGRLAVEEAFEVAVHEAANRVRDVTGVGWMYVGCTGRLIRGLHQLVNNGRQGRHAWLLRCDAQGQVEDSVLHRAQRPAKHGFA